MGVLAVSNFGDVTADPARVLLSDTASCWNAIFLAYGMRNGCDRGSELRFVVITVAKCGEVW